MDTAADGLITATTIPVSHKSLELQSTTHNFVLELATVND